MLEAAQRSSGFVRDVASQTVPTAGIAAPTPLKGGLRSLPQVCVRLSVCALLLCAEAPASEWDAGRNCWYKVQKAPSLQAQVAPSALPDKVSKVEHPYRLK